MLDTSKTYTSKNYGKFNITNIINSKSIMIKFVDTGYIAKVQSVQIRTGSVKDIIRPSVYGVGFVGIGKYKSRLGRSMCKSYTAWVNMLSRCYCPKSKEKYPTYKNVTVCDEWHNFQNFSKWFSEHYIDGFDIDKDIKAGSSKIYSPSTCVFVSHKDNCEKAHGKNYRFINPSGVPVKIYNLADFCLKNNLSHSCMSSVNLGGRTHHKGWVKG